MDRFDIAIIGTGPAGVSAAITANIRNKSIILFGRKNLSDKVTKAHQIKNYPGLPDIAGEKLGEAYKEHLDSLGIEITEEQVSAVYAMGDYFGIQAEGKMYEASTVIIAAGLTQSKPLPGEEELLGRGVSYCATCDAQFYKGKKVAVLGYHKEAEDEARFLAEVCAEVLYFPEYKQNEEPCSFDESNIKVINEKATAITGRMKADALETVETKHEVDGIFILRESISPKQLVPGLELNGNDIKVNLMMETNIPGCYAAGDLTGRPYQYVKAAGQGNVAALSAVDYLMKQKVAK